MLTRERIADLALWALVAIAAGLVLVIAAAVIVGAATGHYEPVIGGGIGLVIVGLSCLATME